MCFGQILAVGTFAFKKIRHGVRAETVNAQVQPEARDIDHFLLYFRVIKIQIWLAGIKAMPVILSCFFIPGPIGWLGVNKDNTRVLIFLIGITPHVIISVW